MLIWNTLTRKKDSLPVPSEASAKEGLRLFVCGPTVYDYMHIGNARTFAVFDTFARFLRHKGLRVTYLQNITDIDDKIIVRAEKENVSARVLARRYEKEFKRDMKALRIESVDRYARATDHIKEIVRQIQTLIQKGHVYEIPGEGWYFDVTTFPDYGKLAGRTVAQAEDGISRIDESVHKRNKADFVVWKFSKPEEPMWNTSLGKGRPGWHIEDTAITEKYFGPQYDIHGAGVDLMFPHHEAEIAQQESVSGKKPMVKIWMHAEFVLAGETKMSKSKGNFVTAREFIEHYSANVFRLLVAQHHYRSRVPLNDAVIAQAANTLGTIQEFYEKLLFAQQTGQKARGEGHVAKGNIELKKYADEFERAMDDDLNTPEALAVIFTLLNEANPIIWNLPKSELKAIIQFLDAHLALFGIILKPLKIPREIKQKVKARELFRTTQQFTKADALREELERLGYKVDDTPAGTLILQKSEARNTKHETNSNDLNSK